MAKSKDELKDMIENGLADEATGKITGENVKNVLTEIVDAMGEGGGGGGGSSQMEYWETSQWAEITSILALQLAYLIKFNIESSVNIVPIGNWVEAEMPTAIGMAIDPSIRMIHPEAGDMTLGDILAAAGGLEEWGFQQVTKEKFYTI